MRNPQMIKIDVPESHPKLDNEVGVVDKKYPYGDIRRYGGIGDGISDDTNAFKNAIANGFDIVLETGATYKCSNIGAVNNVSIRGNNSTIISESNYLFDSFVSLFVKRVTFDFNNKGYGLLKPMISNAGFLFIDRCTFKNSWSTSANYIAQTSVIYSMCNKVIVRDSSFSNLKGHGVELRTTSMFATVLIENCTIDNRGITPISPITSAFGIGSYQSANYSDYFDSVKVINCTVSGCLGSALAMHSMSNVMVTNNTLKNNGEHSIVFQDGVNAVITDNICDTQPGCGVRVQNNSRSGNTGNVVISNNNIIGNGVLLGGKTVFNVSVTNNRIVAGTQYNYGVKITGAYNSTYTLSNDILVQGNSVIGAYTFPYACDNLMNYNFISKNNMFNNKPYYGMIWAGNTRIKVNSYDFTDNIGTPNVIKDTQYDFGNRTGDQYTKFGSGYARILLDNTNIDLTKTKYIGVSFYYSGNTPPVCGIGFTKDGSQILYYATRPDDHSIDTPTSGYYEFIFDVYNCFYVNKPAGYELSDMNGLRCNIDCHPTSTTTTPATITNFKVFKGNSGIIL